MARTGKKRSGKEAVAIIVDGKDEKWYVEKIKLHYPCQAIQSIKIKPELPERKRVQELFDLAKSKLDEEYTFVVLIFDLDEPLKDHHELSLFKDLHNKYLLAKKNELSGRQKNKYGWMTKLLVIVNSPCLEYWFYLHYRKTTKFFADYATLSQELHRIPELADYEKSETYYNNHPDIYERLAKNNALENARKNAIPFDCLTCDSKGASEMNLLFDYFDSL